MQATISSTRGCLPPLRLVHCKPDGAAPQRRAVVGGVRPLPRQRHGFRVAASSSQLWVPIIAPLGNVNPPPPSRSDVDAALLAAVVSAYVAASGGGYFASRVLVELLLSCWVVGLDEDELLVGAATADLEAVPGGGPGLSQLDAEILSSWSVREPPPHWGGEGQPGGVVAVVFAVTARRLCRHVVPPDPDVTSAHLSPPPSPQVIVRLTAERLGATRESLAAALGGGPRDDNDEDGAPGADGNGGALSEPTPAAVGLGGFVDMMLGMREAGELSLASLRERERLRQQAEAEAPAGGPGGGGGGSQAERVMRANTLLVLLAAEAIEAGMAGDRAILPVGARPWTAVLAGPASAPAVARATTASLPALAAARASAEPSDGGDPASAAAAAERRAVAAALLVSLTGSALGSAWCLRDFSALLLRLYLSGWRAQDVVDAVEPTALGDVGGLVRAVPGDDGGGAPAARAGVVNAELLALWTSVGFVTQALLQTPRPPGARSDEGWCWARAGGAVPGKGREDGLSALHLAEFVENALSRVIEERGAAAAAGGGGGGGGGAVSTGDEGRGAWEATMGAGPGSFLAAWPQPPPPEWPPRGPDAVRQWRGAADDDDGGDGEPASTSAAAAAAAAAASAASSAAAAADSSLDLDAAPPDGAPCAAAAALSAELARRATSGAEADAPPRVQAVAVADPWLEGESPALGLMRVQAALVAHSLYQAEAAAEAVAAAGGALPPPPPPRPPTRGGGGGEEGGAGAAWRTPARSW